MYKSEEVSYVYNVSRLKKKCELFQIIEINPNNHKCMCVCIWSKNLTLDSIKSFAQST